MVDYLVLETFDPDLADDPFHDAFGSVIDQFGERHGVYVEPTGRTETDIQIIVPWRNDSGSIKLAMHDNYLVMVWHLEIQGDHPALGELVDGFREALDVLDPAAHFEANLEQMAARPKLVYQVALAAPEHAEPPFVSFLNRAIAHPDAGVRNVAAQAINLLGWPECLDGLQNAYAAERPGLTKSTMGVALRAWERI